MNVKMVKEYENDVVLLEIDGMEIWGLSQRNEEYLVLFENDDQTRIVKDGWEKAI